MQDVAPPPPAIIGPGGLPATICEGLPSIDRGDQHVCVFGLSMSGDVADLRRAGAALVAEGWDAKVMGTSPGDAVGIVDAKGRTLLQLKGVEDRVSRGEFGRLTVSIVAVPIARPQR